MLNLKCLCSGVWLGGARQTLVVLCFFHTLQYVISYTTAHTQNQENNREVPNIPSSSSKTWNIAPNDEKVALFASLIDILERLEVLEAGENSSACITLEKIVREKEMLNESDNTNRIEVRFHFLESAHSAVKIETAHGDSSSGGGLKAPGCNKGVSVPKHGLDTLSRKKERKDEIKSELNVKNDHTVDTDTQANQTNAAALEPGDTGVNKDEKGLSRTQVVVISTCSAVIGVFFLIAGTMRIRNYYKRYRDRRETIVNANRRGSTQRLSVTAHSSGNLRRDSSCSKASSRQSHSNVKNGGDVQIARPDKQAYMPYLTPSLAITDHKPLISGHSQQVQHSNESSHGSLAYIDEDSPSKIKGDDLKDDGSDDNEEFPLLLTCPDSGSYVSLIIDTDQENEGDAVADINEGTLIKTTNAIGETEEFSDNADNCTRLDQTWGEMDPSHENGRSYNQTRASAQGEECNSTPHVADSLNSLETDTNQVLGVECNINIDKTFSVNAGLNQSNSSISENPAYCYGNQTEYYPTGGFIVDGFSKEDIAKHNNLAFDCFDDRVQISTFLENENNYRENGTCNSLNDLSDSQHDHLDSPESLNSFKNNCNGNLTSDSGLEVTDEPPEPSENIISFHEYNDDVITANRLPSENTIECNM